jgi:hypothetical protein
MEGKFAVREELGGAGACARSVELAFMPPAICVNAPPLAVTMEALLPLNVARPPESPLAETEDSARVFDSPTSRSILFALRLTDSKSRLVEALLPLLEIKVALKTVGVLLSVGDGPVAILLRLALVLKELRNEAPSSGPAPGKAV